MVQLTFVIIIYSQLLRHLMPEKKEDTKLTKLKYKLQDNLVVSRYHHPQKMIIKQLDIPNNKKNF